MTLKEEIKWLDSYIKKLVKQGAEVIVLRSILSRLKGLDKKEEPNPYHNEAMGFYHDWLRSFDLPVIRSPSQGQALKLILLQLKGASIDKTDMAALESFKAILMHWGRLNVSLQRNKSLGVINKNLLEIIDKIKNGSTKQQSGNLEAVKVYDRLRSKYNYGNDQNGKVDS